MLLSKKCIITVKSCSHPLPRRQALLRRGPLIALLLVLFPVHCDRLTAPLHGAVDMTGTVFESRASYSCEKGYHLSKPVSRTCLSTGRWSAYAPTCECDGKFCPYLLEAYVIVIPWVVRLYVEIIHEL